MSEAAVYQTIAKTTDYTERVINHTQLVKKIAYHLANRLPKSVQLCDLVQSGMVGLIEAAQNYQMDKGCSFETFASIRIRGAMLDDIRRGDWVPRSVYQNARKISQAIQAVEKSKGKEAEASEIAAKLGVSLTDYYDMVKDAGACELFSLDEINYDPANFKDDDNPLEQIQQSNIKELLVNEIKNLSERDQIILSLYINDELNFKDIAQVFTISESRVCQLYGQAIARLRARMQMMTLES